MKDLFETPEKIPIEIIDLINDFNKSDTTYQNCEILLKKCLKLGYTFKYGLDAIPFNLKKIK
jgi:hypothetical protein